MTGGFLIFALMALSAPAQAAEKESAYDRVIREQVLRCGYGNFPPSFSKDPNTGVYSGVFYELLEELGAALDIRIEYAEEIDMGQVTAALGAGRVDALCMGTAATALRGARMAFTDPFYYVPLGVFVRADDMRFDNNYAAINDPAVRIATNDGDISDEIARKNFPQAQRIAKVQMGGDDTLLMNVVSNKADVTFTAPFIGKAFMDSNPGKIRMVPSQDYLQIYPLTIGIDIHEHELWHMLNAGVAQLVNFGIVDRILRRYDAEYPDMFIRVDTPYKEAK